MLLSSTWRRSWFRGRVDLRASLCFPGSCTPSSGGYFAFMLYIFHTLELQKMYSIFWKTFLCESIWYVTALLRPLSAVLIWICTVSVDVCISRISNKLNWTLLCCFELQISVWFGWRCCMYLICGQRGQHKLHKIEENMSGKKKYVFLYGPLYIFLYSWSRYLDLVLENQRTS